MNYIFTNLNDGQPIVNATYEVPIVADKYNVDTKLCTFTMVLTDENGKKFAPVLTATIPSLNTATLAAKSQQELSNHEE